MDGDLFFRPADRLLEGDLHVVAKIRSPGRARWIARLAVATAEKAFENVPTAAAAEDLPEHVERIVESTASPACAGAGP